jgi:preprotein translocase subunit SecG
MYSVLIILIVIASILMSLIVLIQESKGGGLASGFSSSNQIMGVRKTTDVIEKTTWGLAIAMVVLSVVCAYFVPPVSADSSVLMKPNTATSLPSAPSSNNTATMPGSATPNAQPNQQAQQPSGQQQSAPAAN